MIRKETRTVTYIYYFDISGENVPNEDAMVAFLLDKGIISVCCNVDNPANLYVGVNDYFVPAADSEELPFKDIPKLFEMYRKDGYNGVYQYVADKRGVPNKHWKDKHE